MQVRDDRGTGVLIGDPQKGHGVGAGIGNVMFHACRSFLLREEVQTGEVPPELATGEHSRQHAGGQYISCIKVQAGGNPELEGSFPINDGG